MKANLTRLLLAAIAAALVIAAPASAKTYAVSGKQIAVNENAGKYRMTGSLVGKWKTTSFKTTATSPIARERRIASTARCRRPPSDTCSPSITASSGPRIRNSTPTP